MQLPAPVPVPTSDDLELYSADLIEWGGGLAVDRVLCREALLKR